MNPSEHSRPPRLTTGLLIAFLVLGVVGFVIVAVLYWRAASDPADSAPPRQPAPTAPTTPHTARSATEGLAVGVQYVLP
ncbi:hypothetical protein [Spongiactinospora gelatinilytica]|uniref:hypothetical protein n=1 Tax=Spongiactinospora gelatinilytica TaxID=2666298 RepID=UPI0011B93A47|nr:hypothetical protein [Spongiactinospora gelatinilytica]